jgi:hypothetical protein
MSKAVDDLSPTAVVERLAECLIDMTEFGESWASSVAERNAGPVLVDALVFLVGLGHYPPRVAAAVEHYVNVYGKTADEIRAKYAARSEDPT